GPLDRVLQDARDRAVVLGGEDDDAVGRLDLVLVVARNLREVRLEVGREEGQLLDRHLERLDIGGQKLHEGFGELAVDRGRAYGSDDVADLRHRGSPWGVFRTWSASEL